MFSFPRFRPFVLTTRPSLEKVCIITTDGRNLVGTLAAHDYTTNLVRAPPLPDPTPVFPETRLYIYNARHTLTWLQNNRS